MVAEIEELIMSRLRRVDIEQVVAQSIAAHDTDIVELNLAQLYAGKTAEGESIKPFYRPKTIKLKQKKGQPTDRVTLKDEEDFYKGTFARRTNEGTEVSSSDRKTPFLEARYTVDIFGLSVASRDQLSERLRPTLQDNFNNALL